MLRIKYAPMSATEDEIREAISILYNADIVDHINIEIIKGENCVYKSVIITLIPGKRATELIKFIKAKGSHTIYHKHYWYVSC